MATDHGLPALPDVMLAKAVDTIPEPDSVEGGLSYEPKWDGFRAVVAVGGGEVEIGSRGSKPLTRYFPELVRVFSDQLPVSCVLDGEIVVRTGDAGSEVLDWEALSQRIHPAESRIRQLSEATPASFVAFDLLELDGEQYGSRPFSERRAALEKLFGALRAPLHLSQVTRDVELARTWLQEFEGAGLDGVMAKPLSAAYAPGKRAMFKIKHHRTADVVVLGYRIHKSGSGVGSILLGLYDGDELLNVGGMSAFSNARRLELVDELEPYVRRDENGAIVAAETERSRFSGSKDLSFVPLEPSLVAEVRYDQLEGKRFRHSAQFERWRPDRDATSCTFSQLDTPSAYDLADVLA